MSFPDPSIRGTELVDATDESKASVTEIIVTISPIG